MFHSHHQIMGLKLSNLSIHFHTAKPYTTHLMFISTSRTKNKARIAPNQNPEYDSAQSVYSQSPVFCLREAESLFLHRHLDYREPLFGVFLIPDTIYVASSWCSGYTIALLLNVGKQLHIRLIEAVVGSVVLHADSHRHCRQPLELNYRRVGSHLLHLLAIFNVDVGGSILLVVLNSEAIACRRAFAAKSLHLGSYHIHA